MNEVELLENLLHAAEKLSYDNRDNLDEVQKRTEMIARKIFGKDSHYIKDLDNIGYTPIIIGGGNTDWRTPFESGIRQLRTLIKVMIEDKKLSSNYDEKKPETVKHEVPTSSNGKTKKEVRVMIASPGDVTVERSLLLDKLETKFRRDHYEERCGARIIVEGWESVASQSGYAQDIIAKNLLEKTDIVLAVFRHKLGSPTIDLKTGKDRSPSGTAEELLFAIRNKVIADPPLGMAYFYSQAPVISLDSIDFNKTKEEWERLKSFKNEIKNEILYKSYNIEEEILEIVCKDLSDNIIEHFK